MTEKSKPRVLFLTQTHNPWGGIESWFDATTRWLQNHGWDVVVGLAKGARFNDPTAFLRAHPHLNKPLIMSASSGTEEARISAVMKTVASCLPDVVVPLTLGAVFTAIHRLKRRGCQSRLIVPIHSLHEQYLQNVVENFNVIDQVVAVNRLIEQFFLRTNPAQSARIHYIRHGVTAPLVEHTKNSGHLRVGFIGRLEEASKRVLDLIPLCRGLGIAGIPLELHIVGDGPQAQLLRDELTLYDNTSLRVVFHGYMSASELYKNVYPNLDVLLLFSPTESGPFVAYEAMHHGVVPVASRFLGHACEGVVRHGKNALTFPVGDVETAARHLAALGTNRDLLARLGERAKTDVHAYTKEKSCAEWEMFFRDSLSWPARLPEGPPAETTRAAHSGRLEHWGLRPETANWIRTALGRQFPHKNGFEEWPGSQPVSVSSIEGIQSCLAAIEQEASSRLYSSTLSNAQTLRMAGPVGNGASHETVALSLCGVITTVQEPTASVRKIVSILRRVGSKLIVIGDKKGPAGYELEGVEFLSLAAQLESDFDLARKLPVGHYARKNIGYLVAITQDAGCIYETDDDNAPLDSWTPRAGTAGAVGVREHGWVNVYRFFSEERLWPRGFPLDALCDSFSKLPSLAEETIAVQAPIQQGLVNNSPDVDAIWRLVMLDRPFDFQGGPSVLLPRGAWCPFNSQSTWWFPVAYPLMYLPSFCSFRMTDIWRSFIAQRCLWELDLGVVYHGPEVVQERNAHDLMRDFKDEVPGYLRNRELVRLLEGLKLSRGEDSVGANLVACYEELVTGEFFPETELSLVSGWLLDLEKARSN